MNANSEWFRMVHWGKIYLSHKESSEWHDHCSYKIQSVRKSIAAEKRNTAKGYVKHLVHCSWLIAAYTWTVCFAGPLCTRSSWYPVCDIPLTRPKNVIQKVILVTETINKNKETFQRIIWPCFFCINLWIVPNFLTLCTIQVKSYMIIQLESISNANTTFLPHKQWWTVQTYSCFHSSMITLTFQASGFLSLQYKMIKQWPNARQARSFFFEDGDSKFFKMSASQLTRIHCHCQRMETW